MTTIEDIAENPESYNDEELEGTRSTLENEIPKLQTELKKRTEAEAILIAQGFPPSLAEENLILSIHNMISKHQKHLIPIYEEINTRLRKTLGLHHEKIEETHTVPNH